MGGLTWRARSALMKLAWPAIGGSCLAYAKRWVCEKLHEARVMHNWQVWQAARPLAGLDDSAFLGAGCASMGQSAGMPPMETCSSTACTLAWLWAIWIAVLCALQPRSGINMMIKISKKRPMGG